MLNNILYIPDFYVPRAVCPDYTDCVTYGLLTFRAMTADNGKHKTDTFFFDRRDVVHGIFNVGDITVPENNHLYATIATDRLFRKSTDGAGLRVAGRVQSDQASFTFSHPSPNDQYQLFVTLLPDSLSTFMFHEPTFSTGTFQVGGANKQLGLIKETVKDTDLFQEYKVHSLKEGAVYRSRKRISQHVCAPIINPNRRIGSLAPLNYESRHLPPEMRDFRLRFEDVDFDFLNCPTKPTLSDMVLYEFNGGNQVVAQQPAMLYLPSFLEFTGSVSDDGSFQLDCFTAYGAPSFVCVFCRDADRFYQQPLIRKLSISSRTTYKKSDTIFETDVHELYHLTQRNVHPMSGYDHAAFNKRQTILLAAEDIGILGMKVDSQYQKAKRAVYRFAGEVDRLGTVTVLLVYNNRSLAVQGKQLSVIRL